MGQLWEHFSGQCTVCILPLLYFLFLLPSSSPSSFYGLSVPQISYSNFLSPADTITLLPAAVAIFSPHKICSLQVCVDKGGGKWEKGFRKKFQNCWIIWMNKGSHCLIVTIVCALNSKNHYCAFSFILVLWVPFSCAGNRRAARLAP